MSVCLTKQGNPVSQSLCTVYTHLYLCVLGNRNLDQKFVYTEASPRRIGVFTRISCYVVVVL